MIQQSEFFSTEEQCYLLIHKNACSSIREELYKEFGSRLSTTESKGIKWTVLRDPYERFIDALSYDLRKQDVITDWEDRAYITKYIQTIDMTKYISNHISHTFTKLGRAPHSVLQTIYLFDNNIEVVVLDKDLKHFIDIHFSSPGAAKNMGVSYHQKVVSEILEYLPLLKKEVQGLLAVDYIMLEHMKTQGKVWSWGCGKIW